MLATDYIDRAALHYHDRIAVTDGELSLTCSEVARLSYAVANALLDSGVPRGAHVAILSPNHPLVLVCQYGIMRAGCVWIPANYRNTAADTTRQFAKLDVDFVFFHSSMEAHLAEVDDTRSPLARVPLDRSVAGLPALLDWATDFTARHGLPEAGMDDTLFIAATGGTGGTGIKGAVHTHRTLEVNIATYYAIHQFVKPVVHLVVAPLTHAAGVIHWGLIGQGTTHVIAPSADPGTILEMIERHRVTFLFLPPTLIYMLLGHADIDRYDLSSLEYLTFGSAPMSPHKLEEAVRRFGPVLCQAYGSTEALLVNTYLTREHIRDAVADPAHAGRLAAAGREAPFSRVEILDDDGRMLPPGERGEIVFRSGSIMTGYYKDPDRTAVALEHGWYHTGDIGWKDADGFVYIVDRKNDVIISGGFNLYPAEIERVVLGHPAVQDCAIVGVPDEKWGEASLAVVQLKAGASLNEADLLAFCRERLDGVRTPKSVCVVPDLPRSSAGKVLRREVREPFWQGRSRTI